jgi:hypothetical protein
MLVAQDLRDYLLEYRGENSAAPNYEVEMEKFWSIAKNLTPY